MKDELGFIDLLVKYQNKDCSEKEILLLNELLNKESNQDLLKNHVDKLLFEKSIPKVDSILEEKMWVKIENKIPEKLKTNNDVFHEGEKRSKIFNLLPNNTFWKIAASIVLIITSLSVIYNFQDSQEKISSTMIEKTTKRGEKKLIRLSDGSSIKLNHSSKIKLRENFNEGDIRFIELEGEAFFEVRKSPKPFIVKTGNIQTKVLGTSFNINSYQIKNIQIALVTGKVQVKDLKSSRELDINPNEMVVAGPSQLIKQTFISEEIIGWKEGILVLNEESFDGIITKLENWYGVDIEVIGTIPKKGFEGKYLNESLSVVLEGLSFSGNFKFQINDKKVTIKSNI